MGNFETIWTILYCSPDPPTNSETTNLKPKKVLSNLKYYDFILSHCRWFYKIEIYCFKKDSDWYLTSFYVLKQTLQLGLV